MNKRIRKKQRKARDKAERLEAFRVQIETYADMMAAAEESADRFIAEIEEFFFRFGKTVGGAYQ